MRKVIIILAALFLMIELVCADGSTYLNFTAVNGPATIALDTVGTPDCSISLQYSTDNCNSWNNYSIGSDIQLQLGSKVFFKATNINGRFSNGDGGHKFIMTGQIKADGNIMSLIDANMETNSLPYCAFVRLFEGCTSLLTAPELPATNLELWAYVMMFSGCRSLKKAPMLPATVMDRYCYYGMFMDCTSLVSIPELPATVIPKFCYANMFQGCTSLKIDTSTPGKSWLIPVNVTADDGWNYLMFDGTGGTFTGEPEPGVTYYINSDTTKAQYFVSVNTSNRKYGTVAGGGLYDSMDVATLTATPKAGYKFTGWNNGLTNQTINITVTKDTAITAMFEPNASAVEEIQEGNAITISPNPVHIGEVAYINVGEEVATVEVYAVDGRCMKRFERVSGSVGIEGLSEAGIYVVKVTSREGKVESAKLIVE